MSKHMLQAMQQAMLSRIALSTDTRMSTYVRTDSRRTTHLDLSSCVTFRAQGGRAKSAIGDGISAVAALGHQGQVCHA